MLEAAPSGDPTVSNPVSAQGDAPSPFDGGRPRVGEGLNGPQAEAVFHEGGPLLILAGAGSGKTRVLTHRVAHLVESGQAHPYEILAITFTNKAAAEMRGRVIDLIGPIAQNMWVSTFHSACARILRSEAQRLGYRSGYTIYDQDDQVRLMRHCLEELGYDIKRFPPRSVHARVSDAKNRLVDVDDFLRGETPEGGSWDGATLGTDYLEVTAAAYKLYQRRLYELNAMDFDDLIMRTVDVFNLFEHRLAHYREAFRHVLVDEYQDTNRAQYVLVRLLAEEHRRITVVGDDDQSVYSWRGADIRNILEFEQDFGEATIIKLEQNYRSTTTILDAANAVIAHNRGRKPKRLWSERGTGDPVLVQECRDEHEEARLVAGQIQTLLRGGRRGEEIAVFYRVNAQSRVLEDILVRYNIPYQVLGGTRFYERAEIKDILAYLRVVVNPADDISFQRIVNSPKRGLGAVAQGRLQSLAAEEGVSLRAALALAGEADDLAPAARNAFAELDSLFSSWERRLERDETVAEQVRSVMEESGMIAALRDARTLEAEGRLENLQEFLGVSQEFDRHNPEGGLVDLLAEVSLYADIDSLREQAELVTLMTLHNAKGLEYPFVFITGMEDGMFPHSRALDEQNLEEERRLCYVGITRAMERVHLSYARNRSIYGTGSYQLPSRFLAEIPAALIEKRAAVGAGTRRPPAVGGAARPYFGGRPSGQATTGGAASGRATSGPAKAARRGGGAKTPDAETGFAVGDRVVHAKFGEGVVLGVEAGGVVRVFFSDTGEQKKLLIDYAPLKRL
jgi:DNA helicase-2/ATP-dependent DNA helicase PcrA